jgi:hypothetical protein
MGGTSRSVLYVRTPFESPVPQHHLSAELAASLRPRPRQRSAGDDPVVSGPRLRSRRRKTPLRRRREGGTRRCGRRRSQRGLPRSVISSTRWFCSLRGPWAPSTRATPSGSSSSIRAVWKDGSGHGPEIDRAHRAGAPLSVRGALHLAPALEELVGRANGLSDRFDPRFLGLFGAPRHPEPPPWQPNAPVPPLEPSFPGHWGHPVRDEQPSSPSDKLQNRPTSSKNRPTSLLERADVPSSTGAATNRRLGVHVSVLSVSSALAR